MLRGQQTRAQNVDPCSKIAHTRGYLCANNISVKGFFLKKKKVSQLNCTGHRIKLQVTPIGVEG